MRRRVSIPRDRSILTYTEEYVNNRHPANLVWTVSTLVYVLETAVLGLTTARLGTIVEGVFQSMPGR